MKRSLGRTLREIKEPRHSMVRNEAFEIRVAQAMLLLKGGADPRDLRDEHGGVVVNDALERIAGRKEGRYERERK